VAASIRVVVSSSFRQQVRQKKLIVLCEAGDEGALRAELTRSGWNGSALFLSHGAGAELKAALVEAVNSGCEGLLLAGEARHFHNVLGDTLLEARLSGLTVLPFSRFIELHARRIPLDFVDASWFVVSEGFILQDSLFPQRVKRLGDLLLSILLAAITWPFMLLTALAVKMDSRGPALYRQVRLGNLL